MLPTVNAVIVAVLIFGLLALCAWGGGRLARRVKLRSDELPQMGVMQGAMLGLLALMLGFSFSGAMTRFTARQDLIVAEANAVGTSWLRADLLQDRAAREGLKELLLRYTDARIELFEMPRKGESAPFVAKLNAVHAEAWACAIGAARAHPELTVAILPPLNEVADLLAAHNAATDRHIPPLILSVLMACACASVASVGYSRIFTDKRTLMPGAVLVLLIGASLWITIDLDFPRQGLIRIAGQPLLDLRQNLSPSAKP